MSGHCKSILTQDEWREVAQRIATRVTNGPGSTHARVIYIRDLLVSIATENYEAGRKEAQEEAIETESRKEDAKPS